MARVETHVNLVQQLVVVFLFSILASGIRPILCQVTYYARYAHCMDIHQVAILHLVSTGNGSSFLVRREFLSLYIWTLFPLVKPQLLP